MILLQTMHGTVKFLTSSLSPFMPSIKKICAVYYLSYFKIPVADIIMCNYMFYKVIYFIYSILIFF